MSHPMSPALVGPDFGGWFARLPLPQVLELLAGNEARLRFSDDCGADLVTHHAHLTNTEVIQLVNSGWVESRNGSYILTDAGRRAYIRSTDELQDCGLVAPAFGEQP